MRTLLLLTAVLLVIIISCKKNDFKNLSDPNLSASSKTTSSAMLSLSGFCISDTDDPAAYDSVLKPTILGYHLVNQPYSLTNIRQAYINLYGSSSGGEHN